MNSSKIKFRPFIPSAHWKGYDDTVANSVPKETKREPFATLTYGGVTVEIDYTIFLHMNIGYKKNAGPMSRAVSIFHLAKEEILKEMATDLEGRERINEDVWFRDNPNKCSITHPWSPFHKFGERTDDPNVCLDVNESRLDGSKELEWEGPVK